MDSAVVRRAALIALAACACARSGSSKDDQVAPAAASPSGAPAAAVQATVPSPTASPPAVAPTKPDTPIRIDSIDGARAAIGKLVRLEGTGGNAKLGAVVVQGDLVVYCVDRKDGWSERNFPVVVEGVLGYTSQAKARSGSDGSISAGTGEPIFQMTCDLVR
jgi:hypothetical protein